MSNKVECPYCNYENDLTDIFDGGLPDDNTIDWECQECEREFEIYVEFNPTFSADEIVYEKCEICGKNVRNIYKKGSVYPYPENIKETQICEQCYCEETYKELNN